VRSNVRGPFRPVRWVLFAIAIAVLARMLAAADLPRALALIAAAGPWVFLALAPYAVAVSLDAMGWRRLFAAIGRDAPLASLAGVRVRYDAVASTLPAGTVLAESLTPSWLPFGIEEGVAGMGARKCSVGIAQSLYLLASFGVGYAALSARAPQLPWVVFGLAIMLLVVFGVTGATLFFGRVAARARGMLAALPIPRLRAALDARTRAFDSTDAHLQRFARAGARPFGVAILFFLGAWLVEALETWLLLWLLGAHLSPLDVLAFEASLSLLRSLVFFAPGGIGFQDMGYMAALSALGVADAASVGAAFVVLKRGKEIAWAGVGYSLLAASALPRTRGQTA